MNCSSCGAVLPANSTICQYCLAHNPVDLQAVPGFSVTHKETQRFCPDCSTALQLLEIATKPTCSVDRCPECGGLFLPPGGVAFLLERVVGQVYAVNRALLENLQKELYRQEKVVYRKCPVCLHRMNRLAFGYRSGVVLDRCIIHGDWLDCGEFLHLTQWKKAGGQLQAKLDKPAR
jgi:Zn-finger nucleic acid-binding protein